MKEITIISRQKSKSGDQSLVHLSCGHKFYVPRAQRAKYPVGGVSDCNDCVGVAIDTSTETVDTYSINPTDLLNRSKVKSQALSYSREFKGGKFNRVSVDFLVKINTKLRALIKEAVLATPSKGKTL